MRVIELVPLVGNHFPHDIEHRVDEHVVSHGLHPSATVQFFGDFVELVDNDGIQTALPQPQLAEMLVGKVPMLTPKTTLGEKHSDLLHGVQVQNRKHARPAAELCPAARFLDKVSPEDVDYRLPAWVYKADDIRGILSSKILADLPEPSRSGLHQMR